jgi:hypothetical protein
MLFLEIFQANCRDRSCVWLAVCNSVLVCSMTVGARCCLSRIGSILLVMAADAKRAVAGSEHRDFRRVTSRPVVSRNTGTRDAPLPIQFPLGARAWRRVRPRPRPLRCSHRRIIAAHSSPLPPLIVAWRRLSVTDGGNGRRGVQHGYRACRGSIGMAACRPQATIVPRRWLETPMLRFRAASHLDHVSPVPCSASPSRMPAPRRHHAAIPRGIPHQSLAHVMPPIVVVVLVHRRRCASLVPTWRCWKGVHVARACKWSKSVK